ncbi:MAG: hypothetical protein ACI4T9_01725 [Prevotella sp.]|jgi:hypothetical protein
MIARRSYITPAIEVIASETTQILAASGRPGSGGTGNAKQHNLFDTEEDAYADEKSTAFGDFNQIRNIELPTQKTIWGD